MEQAARAALRLEGFDDARQRHERRLAARYRGQSFELEIEWTRAGDASGAFHRAHQARYGYAQEANVVEIVSVRLRSHGLVGKSKRARARVSARTRSFARPRGEVKIYFQSERAMRAALYVRDELEAGVRLRSPAIVTEYSTTALIPPGARAELDPYGNLIIEP